MCEAVGWGAAAGSACVWMAQVWSWVIAGKGACCRLCAAGDMLLSAWRGGGLRAALWLLYNLRGYLQDI